jgi:hypothetical protein
MKNRAIILIIFLTQSPQRILNAKERRKNSQLVIANPFFAGEAIPARRTCLQQAEAGLIYVCLNVNEILNKKMSGIATLRSQ